MAEGSPPQVDPSLKLILQAVSARGKSDLATIRTIAGLAGAGDALRALEKSFGISEDAAEADIQRMLVAAGDALLAPPTRRRGGPAWSLAGPTTWSLPGEDRVLGLAVAFLAVEAAQLLIIAGAAWLVGAAAPSALAPAFASGGGGRLVPPPAFTGAAARVLAACHLALRSRGPTRPLRLALQLLAAGPLLRRLARLPPPRRRRAAARALTAALALPLLTGSAALLAGALLHARGAAAAVGGASAPPAVLLAQAALAPLAMLPSARLDAAQWQAAGAGVVGAACGAAQRGAEGAAAFASALGAAGRGVKPLRAAWELLETDAWLWDTVAAGAQRLWQVFVRR